MWPFSRKSRRPPRLTGISDQLWSYDAKSSKGWRLDTELKPSARQPRAGGTYSDRTEKARGKLTHYIRAGGMRHEMREQKARRQPIAGQGTVWRLFLLFVTLWVIGRCLPR